MPLPARQRRALAPAAAAAVVLAAALAAACAGRGGRPAPSPGSALWVSAEDAAGLSAADVGALEAGGIGRLVLAAGTLAAGPGAGIETVDLRAEPGAPRPAVRLPVLLAVSGTWGGAAEPAEEGARLAGELAALRRRAEAAGWRPIGFLLDLAVPPDEPALDGYAELLAAAGEAVGDGALLAATVDPAALGVPGFEAIAAGADLLVAFLYGPRPDGGPAAGGEAAWRLDAVAEAARRLDALGTPFWVGVGTVGELTLLASDGSVTDRTTRADLGPLLAAPELAAPRAAVLEGLDRQRYAFAVREPLTVAGRAVPAGGAVAVQRLTAHHLARLPARLAELGLSHHLGQLWMRPPRAGEGLAVPVATLADAAAGRPVGPRLELALEERSAGGGRRVVRVRLANVGGEATEIAALDANLVELTSPSGTFGRVDPGGFRRYELTREGRRVADARAASRADGLRLYVPRLAPGETVVSGDVEVRGGRGAPRIAAKASFLAPGGTVVEAVTGAPAEETP